MTLLSIQRFIKLLISAAFFVYITTTFSFHINRSPGTSAALAFEFSYASLRTLVASIVVLTTLVTTTNRYCREPQTRHERKT